MPEQTLRTEYGVVARASRPGPLPFVLKDGESFAVFDPFGDVRPEDGAGDLGVFHEGARHISRFEMCLWAQRPLLLSSTVREDNCLLVAHLTNPDLIQMGARDSGVRVPNGTVHVQRSSVLTSTSCVQEIAITSYADRALRVPVTLRFDGDFCDVFEIRGMTRPRRGQLRREANETGIRLRYRGLDGRERFSILTLGRAPDHVEADAVTLDVPVEAKQTVRVCFCVDFREVPAQQTPEERCAAAFSRSIERFRLARQSAARIHTSNEQFDQWLNRSFSDIHLLATEAPTGLYPYAGIPWFSAPFGRDGILTARELLLVEPQLARGVLGYLAERQAGEEEPENDAEPGKILHESRLGEMAALREIPFGCYYGSIDSTPLFVMLAGDYLRRTNDIELVSTIWPNLRAAIEWIHRWGDGDGDGFVEYQRRALTGLRNQGWKDSDDSVSHADGTLADGPIAICEVQAYAYGALRAMERISRILGNQRESDGYRHQAERLRRRFAAAFWRPELGTYALALDGQKRPCDVRASNAGHALWTGIATPEHAAQVGRSLLGPSSFTGWGVRTLDERELRYSPMSYHNGSIWPHDNALVALGLARYGLKAEAVRIMTGLFDASSYMPMHRLPELFCGFARQEDEGPTLYPVACMPQSWASGAVFALLEAALGLSVSIDAGTGRPTVRFTDPMLPPYLERVQIRDLRVADESVDIELHRYDTDVGVHATRRSPNVDVVITM